MLAKLADWRKVNAKGEAIPAPPPTGVVKSLLATPDPGLPILAGIVTTPVFGRGGVLLTEPGYHPDARLLYRPTAGFRLPPFPTAPRPRTSPPRAPCCWMTCWATSPSPAPPSAPTPCPCCCSAFSAP